MIEYLTVPTLKFDRGKLSNKELDKKVRFASKKQYSVWNNSVIDRDFYAKRALNTQTLMLEMQKYPYTVLVSFLENYKACKYWYGEPDPLGLRDLMRHGIRYDNIKNYEYALSILPLKYRNA